MKTISAFTLLLLAALSGPALAETAKGASLASDCKLDGPTGDATEACKAQRESYRAEVRACMDLMQAEALARVGKTTGNKGHSYRARFLTCDSAVRAKMAALSN